MSTEMQRAIEVWLGAYLGRRQGETLEQAMRRMALRPNPLLALMAKKDGR